MSNYFLEKKSTIIYPIPYSQKNKKIINKEIQSKSNHDYLLLGDLDSNEHPCITHKKEDLMKLYTSLDSFKIIVVKEEIESWFLAGIDTSLNEFKNFNIPHKTDLISKEQFDSMLKEKLITDKEEFLLKVCKTFNIELAMKRNDSFNYFIEKYFS